ncbi:MAG: hypothetical protein RJA70_29 [Pseudomonadota bacterium]|jgi:organic radical activating enzyme
MASTESLRVSEIFHSLQGEGPNAGTPCSFLRLADCNLSCAWCDSSYTWNFEKYDRETEVKQLSVTEVAEQLAPCNHLVITGGEPLLQQKRIPLLLQALDSKRAGRCVEVETNGTLLPNDALWARINQWNVSPKLGNAKDPLSRRILRPTLSVFSASDRAYLKLVVESDEDLSEARELVDALNWPKSRVLLMPQARTPAELAALSPWVAAACIANGFRYSPRLHIALWGERRGV